LWPLRRALVKQQQCAMKLYRITNNPKHIMWAVCSLLLQSRENPKLQQLAAGMCTKLETAGAIDNREALLVYARVLRESGKGDKALELLGSALGDRCVPMKAERLSLCAIQAAAAGLTAEAAGHWRGVLELAPDDWVAMSAVGLYKLNPVDP
jgi:N-terminal acetyltransferase B complex non-catalytic subunit